MTLTRVRGISCSVFARYGKMGSRFGRATVALCGSLSSASMQTKGWLSAIKCSSMAKIKVRGLVSCCGQDGYRAQVLQLPINTYTHITSINL